MRMLYEIESDDNGVESIKIIMIMILLLFLLRVAQIVDRK
jgi:hypothetical protein